MELEKIQRGKGILNKCGKVPCHRHRRWLLERVTMVAQGPIVVVQASDGGGSRGNDDCAREWGCRGCEGATWGLEGQPWL